MRLAEIYGRRFPLTARATAAVEDGIADLQFTESDGVPFEDRRGVRAHLGAGAVVQSSDGGKVKDHEGNELGDRTGAEGVDDLG